MEAIRLSSFTRGDTFILSISLYNKNQEPLILDTQFIRSQIRTRNGVLQAEIDISSTSTPGLYLFQVNDTQNWPTVDLYMDIQTVENGITTSSPLYVFEVIRDVTRNE